MTEPRSESIESNAAILPNAFSIGSLFGTNGPLTQIFIYGIVSQLLGAAMGPVTQEINNNVWPLDPSVPLSPADAASAVVRQIMSEDEAAAEAKLSGYNRDRFHKLYLLSGDAPAAEFLAVALRRGFITEAQYEKGVAQGRLRTEWSDTVKQMAVEEPSPTAMLNALLEGQLDEATAKRLYAKLGGSLEYFDILFNTQGSAPTPLEAAEMARRGIIPWTGRGPTATSFEQAFLEGPWRNKWQEPYKSLADYIPPPRTINAMLSAGQISRELAIKGYKANGVPDEWLPAFLAAASHEKTSTDKNLTQGTVLTLYEEKLITEAQATGFLKDLNYSDDEAGYIIAAADFRLHAKYLGLALSRVHTLYTTHKIDRGEAVTALTKLEVDTADQTVVLQSWDLERGLNVRSLTPAEIATAMKYDLMTGQEALAKLHELGYPDADAWLYLAAHLKGNYSTLGDPPPGVHPKYGPTGPGPTLPVP